LSKTELATHASSGSRIWNGDDDDRQRLQEVSQWAGEGRPNLNGCLAGSSPRTEQSQSIPTPTCMLALDTAARIV
jgi:hypothetical protein